MCGIIALSARPFTRPVPSATDILARLDAAVNCGSDIVAATTQVAAVNELLKGVPGVMALAGNRELISGIESRLARLDATIATADTALETASLDPERLEAAAAELIAARDAVWSIGRDRLRTARAVADLAGRDAGVATLSGYLMIQQAFAAIDRMEVRGRDSAGIHVFVWGHGLGESDLRTALDARATDPLFQSGSVRWIDGVLSFVYKAAAEIGELGDNTKVMRDAVRTDDLLRRALSHPGARTSLVGHTRWASVGIISEPNAHPVNSERSLADAERPYVIAALNGDVDNHADLRIMHGLSFPGQITTDAKVIPALVTKHRQDCGDTPEAFRRTVASFEGSVAIAAAATDDPERLLLALHGSGQGLFVGLAEDLFIVASEPYGVVEETNRYFRLDGEGAGAGQIVVLDGRRAGELDGVERIGYDGSMIPVDDRTLITAEVTTRDIDRGDSPHFLLKEIGEAPESFRKTLRGKIVEVDGRLVATVGARSLPDDIRRRLADGTIDKVRVIGQGTAAIAGRSCASVLDELCGGELDVDPITATELSGFNLRLDMSDTLIVAVSQSGTTTDTNRTVDLAR
ncbi:MAG: glucosamine-6-phosphate synthase, partial [Actinomycetes bacterium]